MSGCARARSRPSPLPRGDIITNGVASRPPIYGRYPQPGARKLQGNLLKIRDSPLPMRGQGKRCVRRWRGPGSTEMGGCGAQAIQNIDRETDNTRNNFTAPQHGSHNQNLTGPKEHSRGPAAFSPEWSTSLYPTLRPSGLPTPGRAPAASAATRSHTSYTRSQARPLSGNVLHSANPASCGCGPARAAQTSSPTS